jgi:monoamine oxidase
MVPGGLSQHARELRQYQSGPYTTLLDVAPEPALKGRLQFAGEHTSCEFLGFTNGGVQSGNRASEALIKIMALHK